MMGQLEHEAVGLNICRWSDRDIDSDTIFNKMDRFYLKLQKIPCGMRIDQNICGIFLPNNQPKWDLTITSKTHKTGS